MTGRYHELDSSTISAFLDTLKNAGFQPDERLELNTLYHCRTERKKDKKFAWYRIGYDSAQKAFVGSFGSFTLDTQRVEYPVYDDLTPEQAAKRQKQQAAFQAKTAALMAKRLQEEAQEREQQEQQAKRTAALAAELMAAASSDILPEYLVKKKLPLVAPAKGISGRDLLRLLPVVGCKKVRRAVCLVSNQSARVFGLVPVYRRSGELSNVQILLPEKVDIHDDGKPGNKLFLPGKGTLSGCYLALTPLSDVPNGTTLLVFEGYAKAIPAYMAGKPCLVAFSVGNIRRVNDLFAPSDYPTKEAWQHKEKAMTWPRRFSLLNCADNDTAALRVAKKERYRVKSVFPVFPGVKDWDDLYRAADLQEVVRQLDEPRHLDAAYHATTPEQFISDLKLDYPNGVSWLIADTGNGKTQEVCRYASEHAESMVVLVAPLNGICEQTARSLLKKKQPFQLVMGLKHVDGLSVSQEYQYDAPGLCVTTLAKFVLSFDFSAALYPVVLFADEAHTLTADTYRQQDIDTFSAMLPRAEKAALLTATPYFFHDKGLQAAPKIYVEKAGKPKTRVSILYYPKDEFSVIRHYAEKGRVVVEMNSRTSCKTLQKALQARGFQGVYTLSADDKKSRDEHGIYRHIMKHERLPMDCRILLTTKLYEMGLNIQDTDIHTVLVFGKKPLNIRRVPDAMPTPHDIKQIANRTRHARPDVFLCLPECARNDNDMAFDGASLYRTFQRRAERQRAEYLDESYTTGRAAALAMFNNEMREGTPRLLTWEQGTPNVSAVGVDMAVCERYRAALLFSGKLLRRELNDHGLTFGGETLFSECSGGASLSDDDKAALASAADATKEEQDAAFMEAVVDMAKLTDKQLDYHDSRHAPKMKFFRRMATPEQAAALLLTVGRETRAFNEIKGRLHVLKAMTAAARSKRRLNSAAAIMAFLKQGTFTGKQAADCLTDVFRQDRVLRHELLTDKAGNVKTLSEKRALAALRKLRDVEKKHTETGYLYEASTAQPVVELWKTALGITPFSSQLFQKYLAQKSHVFEPETPVSVGETPDTLKNESVYRDVENQCVRNENPNALYEFLSAELADDFEERAAIMQFVGGLTRQDAEREARRRNTIEKSVTDVF